MKRTMTHLIAGTGLLIAAVAMAHPSHTKVPLRSETVMMKGEIIDPQCYFMHDGRGMTHAACATRCAKGGQGISFLDDVSGVVYPLIAKTHGASQNEGLLPYLGKSVQVKGLVLRKASNAVMLIQSVTALPAKAK